MKKEHSPGFGAGLSSLLLIFVILCLVTFAALSLTSANADYRLSQKMKAHTEAYYKASNEAADILARIDLTLESAYRNSPSKEAYFTSVAGTDFKAETGWDIGADGDASSVRLSYTVGLEGGREQLNIALDVLYPEAEGAYFYRTVCWKLESTEEWSPDNPIRLYHD